MWARCLDAANPMISPLPQVANKHPHLVQHWPPHGLLNQVVASWNRSMAVKRAFAFGFTSSLPARKGMDMVLERETFRYFWLMVGALDLGTVVSDSQCERSSMLFSYRSTEKGP